MAPRTPSRPVEEEDIDEFRSERRGSLGPPSGEVPTLEMEANSSRQRSLPGLPPIPPLSQVAFLAGVGALVAVEMVEWPAAVAIAIGHAILRRK
jgi:hypothetical protein